MNVMIFSVFDQAATRYMDPFCAPTIEFAIRGFREACGTDKHQFNKFPEDYALYHVADFDPELGVIIELSAHKIANASSFANNLLRDDQVEALYEGKPIERLEA